MEPNLALLIACCRFAFAGGDQAVLRDRLRGGDGPRLTALAARHRVKGIVWRSLRAADVMLPGTERLGAAARQIAANGLAMAADSGRIQRTLAAALVPHLFLKGQALGVQAWGDATVKRQADIDLLVLPAAIPKVARLLDQLGYVQQVPEPSVDPADWHRRAKESLWRSDDGLMLDLHSRVADNVALLPRVTATATPEMVEITGGITLPTLPRALLLPYLAVHGASSAWFRLKWLAEFAAIVHRTDPRDLSQIVERGPAIGAGRTLPAALVLSHRLFDTALPSDLWFDGGARRMVSLATAQLNDAREPTERRLGTLGIHLSQALMMPGRRYLASELIRQAGAALTG